MTSHFDPEKIAIELAQRGEDWADTDSAYRALDETTKTVLAEVTLDYLETAKSVAESETRARASQKYREHLACLSAARREANRARVKLDTYKAYVELLRTQSANRRAEMNLR